MPNLKLSELSSLSSLVSSDKVMVLDVSDTSFGISGTNKQVLLSDLDSYLSSSLNSVFYPRTSNPSGYLTSLSPTGQLTGAFYPLSANPLNYITSSQTGAFASDIELANATGLLTGQFISHSDVITSSGGYLSESGKFARFDKYGELNSRSISLPDFGHSIDKRIFNLTASTGNKLIFSVQDHSTPTYVRNTGCWAYDIDLTPISVWNSESANQKGGILISPRHILFANHFSITTGSTVRFVTRNNTVVNRTLSNSTGIGSTDLRIGVLDSDVPNTISFAKVLPKQFTGYYNLSGAPMFYTDQDENALVAELNTPGTGTRIDYYIGNSRRSGFYESVIVGDSGGPMCLVYGNQLVALSSFETNQYGPSLHYNYDAVNNALTVLGGGYQLTNIDQFPVNYNSLIDRPVFANSAFITSAFLPSSGQIPLVGAGGVLDPSVIPSGLNFTGGLTNVVFTTGNQLISGVKEFVNGITTNEVHGIDFYIDINNASLVDDALNERVNWQNGRLGDAGGVTRVDWTFLQLSGNWRTNTIPTQIHHIINKQYFDANAYPLLSNPSGYVRSTTGTVTVQGGATISDGQLLIGSSGDNAFIQGGITAGSGIVIQSGSGTITIHATATGAGGGTSNPFAWALVTGATTITMNSGYMCSGASRITLTLPASATLGSYFKATSIQTGGFKISQNSGQIIYFGPTNSTAGTGGYIQSSHTRDSVEVVCIGANSIFQIVNSVGNIELV